MRKAAMPVPYIIALIIGVIVVAVLAYWFISTGGKGANVGKEAECTARKVEFCASKTSDVWQKMTAVCGNKAFKGEPVREIDKDGKKIQVTDCYDFCSTIIPNWEPPASRTECKKPE